MATTEYKPNGHGAARNTVSRHHPRVVDLWGNATDVPLHPL